MRIKFKVSQCDCSICASMCKNPCIPTPEEAQELINRGHKDNLEVWHSYGYIPVVRPIRKLVDQTKEHSYWEEGYCAYFDKAERKCLLHILNLKPLEGRLANHAGPSSHEYVCSRWESPLGRELVNFIQELNKETDNYEQ